MIFAMIAVGVLVLLSFVIFTLNGRLDNQREANEASIEGSARIVDINDRLTVQLRELTALTESAQGALDATAALGPALQQLDQAISPAADTLAANTRGAQLTNEQLLTIQSALDEVQNNVLPLVTSAEAFGDQGVQLLNLVNGLVADLESSVSSAQTINQMLPLPG